MKKLKYWLKVKLESFFGIDILKTELKNRIIEANSLKNEYTDKIKKIDELNRLLSDSKIAADIGYDSRDRSWAVICLGGVGTKETVRFFNLPNNNIKEIEHFLSRFRNITKNRNNYIIDDPFHVF